MDLYIAEVPFWLVNVFGVGSAAVGIWRGGRVGSVLGLVILVQLAIAEATPGLNPYWLAVAEDVLALAICLALALTGRNYWTLFATATQVLSVMTQVLRGAVDLPEWGYYSALRTWFLLFVASLLIGSLLPRPKGRAAPVEGP